MKCIQCKNFEPSKSSKYGMGLCLVVESYKKECEGKGVRISMKRENEISRATGNYPCYPYSDRDCLKFERITVNN